MGRAQTQLLPIYLMVMLSESGRTASIGNRGGAELGKRAGIADRPAELTVVDRSPIVARGQLFAIDHLVQGGDRSDQQAPVERALQQLGLGLGEW